MANNNQPQARSAEFLRIEALITHPPATLPGDGPLSLHAQINSATLTNRELEDLLTIAQDALHSILTRQIHVCQQQLYALQAKQAQVGRNILPHPANSGNLRGDVAVCVLQRLRGERVVREMGG